jgi:hypothetical protein
VTRDEVIDLQMVMQAAYPNYKPPDKTVAVNTWLMMLEEYDKRSVMMAIKAYIATDTSGFAPSIGQVIDKIKSITTPKSMSEIEAWSLVRKAISDSGYNATARFNELPMACQRAVGSPSQLRMWALDTEFNENVVSSNFMRCYRSEIARQREIDRMPSEIRQMIDKVNNNSKLLQDEQANLPEITQDKNYKLNRE